MPVGVGVAVLVADGSTVGVDVRVGVGVAVLVADGSTVDVGVAVRVGVAVGVAVFTGADVGVRVGVGVGVDSCPHATACVVVEPLTPSDPLEAVISARKYHVVTPVNGALSTHS